MVVAEEAHEYDNDQDTVCNECGYEREIVTPPVPECQHEEMEWAFNEDGHWSECKAEGCEHKTNMEPHEFDNVLDPDCVCGYEREVKAPTVTLNKDTLALVVPNGEQLIATVTPEGLEDYRLFWSSNDETVATVDNNGTFCRVGIV